MTLRALMAIAALISLAGCAAPLGTSPRGLELPIETAALKLSSDLQEGGYRAVATAELKRWLDEGKALTLISTIPYLEEREAGVMPGAQHAAMPFSDAELMPEDREHMLMAAGPDKNRTLVVYCVNVACRRSHVGAKLLKENGYRNVYRYPAGAVGWGEAGYLLIKQK